MRIGTVTPAGWRLSLIFGALCLGLASLTVRADELIREFTIKEAFGVSHPDQVIDFDFAGQVDWANAYMLGPDGSEVPYQRLSDGKIAVRTDVPANTSKSWKLMSGRPPGAFDTGIIISETEEQIEIVNGLTGVRIPTPMVLGAIPPAPVQAVRFRDGTWSGSGFNDLTFPKLGSHPRPTIATNMTVRFLERGPLKATVEVAYGLWHDRAENPGKPDDLAPAGSAYYKSTIELQAGQPSILFEEDTDTEIYWLLDVFQGVRATNARYRGFGASAKEYGYEADGRQYRDATQRPGVDAFIDLQYSHPVWVDYYSSPTTRKPMAIWEPWIRDSGKYWQLFGSNAPPTANIAGTFAGRASSAIGAASSGVGVVTQPGGVTDIVSKLDPDGRLHSVHQTGNKLWYVRFDEALTPSEPLMISVHLRHPDLVTRANGRVLVAGFERHGGSFGLLEQNETGGFIERPLVIAGSNNITIRDPYPYLATAGGREFLFFFGAVNELTGGVLLSREIGEEAFTYRDIITDYGHLPIISQSRRPAFTSIPGGKVVLYFPDSSGLVARATIPEGALKFGAPGDGRVNPGTGVGGIYDLGTGLDPLTGHVFAGDQTDELWHMGESGTWKPSRLPLRGDYWGQGPNRRTLATAPNGDAIAVHNRLDHQYPESQMFLHRAGQWQLFPHATRLGLSSARTHYHSASQQFLLLGRADGMLQLFGWRGDDQEPRLIQKLPETEERSVGFGVTANRWVADARFYPRIRYQWGLFLGVKGQDLQAPDQIQSIARQMNLHAGINLNKMHRWEASFPDPPQGYGALFMDRSVLQAMIQRLRAERAKGGRTYYDYLMRNSHETAVQNLINLWADGTGNHVKSVVNDVSGSLRNILNTFINGDGIYEWRYHYWIGGAEMNRHGIFIDSVLADDLSTPGDRSTVKGAAVAFANLLWDDDFVPMFEGHGLAMGTENMRSQQTGYRNFYALMLANHPTMTSRAGNIGQAAIRDVQDKINEAGSQVSSTHYVETWTPTLTTLLQLRMGDVIDPFRKEQRLAKFAEFYMNFSTPPEPRFGGLRKLVSIGDGSTESMPMFGLLGTGFRTANPALSERLMGMWHAQGRPHSAFWGSTLLMIDENATQADPLLGSAHFPGWYSTLRHGWGTANETTLWLVNGDFYRDHRHEDHGSVVIYALGAPLSIDWGSTYSPHANGPYMHSMVTPESAYSQPWDSDNLPLAGYPHHWSHWLVSTQGVFVALPGSAMAQAKVTSDQGMVWTRSTVSIHPNEQHPALLIVDDFSGPNAETSKIFTQNLMARGDVLTPGGSTTPPLRSWFNYGASPKTEFASAGPVMELKPGVNRFGFTGQWLIDWDLYSVSDAAQQAHIGNWGHDWHPSAEANQFRSANGRSFEERQHILRIRGHGSFKTLILPYRKGQRPEGLAVRQDGANLVVDSADQQTTIGPDWFAFRGADKTVLTTFGNNVTSALGWELSGGPTEIVMSRQKFVVTASGAPGLRRLKVPGNWVPESPLVKVGDAFQLAVSDAGAVTAIASIPNHAPEIQPMPDQTFLEGTQLTLEFEASDPDTPVSVSRQSEGQEAEFVQGS